MLKTSVNSSYEFILLKRCSQLSQVQNSRPLQAWKMISWNSRTFQDLYEPSSKYRCWIQVQNPNLKSRLQVQTSSLDSKMLSPRVSKYTPSLDTKSGLQTPKSGQQTPKSGLQTRYLDSNAMLPSPQSPVLECRLKILSTDNVLPRLQAHNQDSQVQMLDCKSRFKVWSPDSQSKLQVWTLWAYSITPSLDTKSVYRVRIPDSQVWTTDSLSKLWTLKQAQTLDSQYRLSTSKSRC